jgi:hypothetical protein
VLGEDHLDTINSMHGLGHCLVGLASTPVVADDAALGITAAAAAAAAAQRRQEGLQLLRRALRMARSEPGVSFLESVHID